MRGEVGVVILRVQIIDGPIRVFRLVSRIGSRRRIAFGQRLRQSRNRAVVSAAAGDEIFAVPFVVGIEISN